MKKIKAKATYGGFDIVQYDDKSIGIHASHGKVKKKLRVIAKKEGIEYSKDDNTQTLGAKVIKALI